MKSMFVLSLTLALAACSTSLDNAPIDSAVMDSGPACAAPKSLRYYNPGCDAQPTCSAAPADLCLRQRCSCTGKVIGGCDYYGEPWIDSVLPQLARSGDSCATDAR